MKNLNDYIQEKYLIDMDIDIDNDSINKVFKNLDDLIDALNNYFGDELEKPIEVYSNDTQMPADNKHTIVYNVYNKFSINKKEPVKTLFKKLKTIKGALLKHNGSLILQGVYEIGGEKELGTVYSKDSYKFGKDNFYEWIDKNIFYGFHDFFHIPQVNLG